MPAAKPQLCALFPLPNKAPSALCPDRLAGITYETESAVASALKSNHEERHLFANEWGFHNHTSHHLLATFAMGAPSSLFPAIYNSHEQRNRPASTASITITKDSFYEYIGKQNHYDAYLQFFDKEVLEKGMVTTIEEYVFSLDANIEDTIKEDKPPRRMLNRALSRLYHPMIHIGYGLEFGIPGLVSEGLAQTASHPLDMLDLLPISDFDRGDSGKDKPINEDGPQDDDDDIFSILAHMLRDERFSPTSLALSAAQDDGPEGIAYFSQVSAVMGETILLYAQHWRVDGSDAEQVARRIEELSWLNAVLYGVCGWDSRKSVSNGRFNADFFLMHAVTSSLFLPSFATHLKPFAISLLLRAYLISSLTWWVARGRPAIPIREFYSQVNITPLAHYEQNDFSTQNENLEDGFASTSINPWLSLIQGSLAHADEHLCKAQRSLLHFASRYGDRPAGSLARKSKNDDVELEGVDVLDGTLFVRIAGLTAARLGPVSEWRQPVNWDFRGFFPS